MSTSNGAGFSRARAQDDAAEVVMAAKGGGLNLVGSAFTQAARFLVTLMLARKLGSGQVGVYYEAQAFLALLGLLALSGFRGALTRFVAVHLADGDKGSLTGTIRLGVVIPTVASALMAVILYSLSEWFATSVFQDPELALALRYVALALPGACFTDAALSATQGFKTMKPYVAVGLIFEPAMRLGLSLVLLGAGLGLEGAMLALVITSNGTALLAGAVLLRFTRRHRSSAVYRLKELFAFSTVSWMSSLASNAQTWTGTLILGILGTSNQVGIYQVATRVTLLATFFLGPLGTSFAPMIADLYRREEFERLGRMYVVVSSWTLRLSLPSFAIVILFPDELLSVFGNQFVGGAAVTVILAVGQLFNVAGGPNGYMLVMSGRPALTMANNLTALVLNVVLNLVLIPRFGLIGAGIAFAASVAFNNIAKVIQVWFTMRMHPFDIDFWKACLSGAAAFGLGLAVRQGVVGTANRLFAGLAIVVIYFGIIVALGIGADDRLVLDKIWRRLRPARVSP